MKLVRESRVLGDGNDHIANKKITVVAPWEYKNCKQSQFIDIHFNKKSEAGRWTLAS